MQDNTESTLVVEALLFAARCLLPLLLMLGVSYLLRRLGLIAAPPPPPPEVNDGENGPNGNNGNDTIAGGGVAHGKV